MTHNASCIVIQQHAKHSPSVFGEIYLNSGLHLWNPSSFRGSRQASFSSPRGKPFPSRWSWSVVPKISDICMTLAWGLCWSWMQYDRKTWECTQDVDRCVFCDWFWLSNGGIWKVCMSASAAEEAAEFVSLPDPGDGLFRNVAEVPDGVGVRLDFVGGVDSIWFCDVYSESGIALRFFSNSSHLHLADHHVVVDEWGFVWCQENIF